MHKIIFSKTYEKKVRKFIKKHPDIKSQYYKTLKIMEHNIFHPSLRYHDVGKYQSVSINMKYRIAVDFIIQDNRIFLIDIGNHDKIYS